MNRRVLGSGLLGVLLGWGAEAQVINGDFETGQLAPWVVTNTPQGRSVFTSVAMFDIDGAGELPESWCA